MTEEQIRELKELAREARGDTQYGEPDFYYGCESQEKFYRRALDIFAPGEEGT